LGFFVRLSPVGQRRSGRDLRGRSSPATAISGASDRSGRSASDVERPGNLRASGWLSEGTAWRSHWWPAGPGGGHQLLELVPQQLRVRVNQSEELGVDVIKLADVGVRRRIVRHENRGRSRGQRS
jgi:hypothetical protein